MAHSPLDWTVSTETRLTQKFFLFQEVDEDTERTKLREVSKRLYAQLQEAEKKHQEEKERLQVTASSGGDEWWLHHGNKAVKPPPPPHTDWREQTEGAPERAGGEVEDGGRRQREERSAYTRAAQAPGRDGAGERRPAGDHPQPRGGALQSAQDEGRRTGRRREVSELPYIRRGKEWVCVRVAAVCLQNFVWTFRAKRLEKEVAVLKEKIHHLDDMLKSQQRKVRHMIEQVRATCHKTKGKHFVSGWYLSGIHSVFDGLFAHLQLQNSRMVIQERDRVIKDLEEKVAFLEAEVRAV